MGADSGAAVRALQETSKRIRAQIEAERAANLTRSEFAATVASAQDELKRLSADLEAAKALSRQRQDEIDQWHRWFQTLADDQRTDNLPVLNQETEWRLKDVAALEKQISEMLTQQIAKSQSLEASRVHLADLQAGITPPPIDQDPRLAAIEKAIAEAGSKVS